MSTISQWQLRASFAAQLSTMYGNEVPAYNTLLNVSHDVNRNVVDRDPELAQRLGTIDRVTAERHGAIRVGTPTELSQVARVFAGFGMHPVGFYDLRDASKSAVPVISTAFRPKHQDELARNPFRVFTSMLVTGDRRFFSEDLGRRAENFLAQRRLFSPRVLELADRAAEHGELAQTDAEEYLNLAVGVFEISADPVDRAWYSELETVSAVAADIAGVSSTHINHLTPRVLDIDDLYTRMSARGIEMIDDIQGPPRFNGPDVLLRQTSFRALAEPRLFREPDGTVAEGSLRVRFGEVEARGIAVTRAGRKIYETAIAAIDQQVAAGEGSRSQIAEAIWGDYFPSTELGLLQSGLGHFTFQRGSHPERFRRELSPAELVEAGVLEASPIVYEDFLPRSAAGIFQSNLTDAGSKDEELQGTQADINTLSESIGQKITDPEEIYASQSTSTLRAAIDAL